jgi:hypothetical protein
MNLLEAKNPKAQFPVKYGVFSHVIGFCRIDALPHWA